VTSRNTTVNFVHADCCIQICYQRYISAVIHTALLNNVRKVGRLVLSRTSCYLVFTGFLDFVHRQYFEKNTSRKVNLFPSSGEKVASTYLGPPPVQSQNQFLKLWIILDPDFSDEGSAHPCIGPRNTERGRTPMPQVGSEPTISVLEQS
jgi:hypothetical protein